jgi:hypothetical protein
MTAAVCTGGSKYKVVLVNNTSTNVDVYLNSVLLERNLALPDNIEQILEMLDPVCLEGADTSEESDVEPEETRIVELPDISVSQHPQMNAVSPSAEDSISDDEEYDILVDDPLEFLREMMRVSTYIVCYSVLERTNTLACFLVLQFVFLEALIIWLKADLWVHLTQKSTILKNFSLLSLLCSIITYDVRGDVRL